MAQQEASESSTTKNSDVSEKQPGTRRPARKGGSKRVADPFLAGLQQDRAAQRELRAYEAQGEQANKAREFRGITKLKRGSVARKVALRMLDAFPMAQATTEDGGKRVSKTEVARREALEGLNERELKQVGGINFGADQARRALSWAFDELKKPKEDVEA